MVASRWRRWSRPVWILHVVLLAVLVLPLALVLDQPPVAAAASATVNTSSLRLRSGPSTDHQILAVMSQGEQVTVLEGPTNGWSKVQYKSLTGWASADYLTPAGSSAPSAPPSGTGTATVNTDALRLRSGPGTSYAVLRTMSQGESVTIVSGPSNGWYQVTFKGTTGWASAQYLALGGGSSAPSPPPSSTGTATVNTSSLRLRSGPGTSYAVLRTMSQGESVAIVSGPSNGWYQVTYKGTTGWASADYLTRAGSGTPSAPPGGTPTSATMATIAVDQLNLRSAPNTGSSILARMRYGETVKIVSASGAWYQVTYGSTTGWAYGEYLALGGSSASSDSASFWVPVHQQEHSLSCEYASLQIATAALGNEIHEDRFIPVVGKHANPHYGFRGNIDAEYIFGTDDYGVYPEALAKALATFGFTGEVFYGGPETLKAHLRAGTPVVVWIDLGYDTSFTMMIEGEPVTMAPRSHVVVAYGYSPQGVLISDPDSSNPKRLIPWRDFNVMWSSMDQMALAVRRG